MINGNFYVLLSQFMTFDPALLDKVLKKANTLLDRLETSKPPPLSACPDHIYALRWNNDQGAQAIVWESKVQRDDLLHIDRQAKLLFANTQQFVAGLPANNALLWGTRGTGKSSLLQAMLSAFFPQNLRVMEITRHDFRHWSEIVAWVQNQEFRFILFCDDLSFDADDDSYRQIKAALDGSLNAIPDNALVYATSNRRHLLPEKLADNLDAKHINGEVHHSEAVEEAISLSDRFGLWLSFHPLNQDQYLDIVQHWLTKFGVEQEQNTYREEALRWALQRGSRSGRIANQFARSYAGNYLLKNT